MARDVQLAVMHKRLKGNRDIKDQSNCVFVLICRAISGFEDNEA